MYSTYMPCKSPKMGRTGGSIATGTTMTKTIPIMRQSMGTMDARGSDLFSMAQY